MADIYCNRKVFTGELPLISAFAVENGRFIAAGSDAEVLNIKKAGDTLTDLHGAFVCPGFNDSHMHLLNFGQVLLSAQLQDHTGSLRDVLDTLMRHLAEHPLREGAWLTGRGWNQDYFTDVHRMPDRFDLDKVSDKIPIMITRTCGHCCVLNSKALALAGIDAETVSPPGGSIGMQNGMPDGRLYDNAMDLLIGKLPTPDKEGIKDMIRLACRELNGFGITSTQTDDYCVFREIPPEVVNEAYRELEASGELTVRVYEQCNFTEPDELRTFIQKGNTTGTGSDMFKIGPLKLLGDGALGSRTAHLSIPYVGTENCGFSLFSKEKLNELVSIANAGGMQVAVHAIGDACLDRVLDAIELALAENPREDHRHGIVHCQITRKDQLDRIEKLGLNIYAQSVFLDYDNHIVTRIVDPKLYRTSYNWKTLLRAGVNVSNGSDCPVELPDVMKGIECAVTRRSLDGTGPYLEDQAFTVLEALQSFTVNGAKSSFEENEKGRIGKGYSADFVILDSDPFETAARSLHSIRVRETFLGGRRVFKA